MNESTFCLQTLKETKHKHPVSVKQHRFNINSVDENLAFVTWWRLFSVELLILSHFGCHTHRCFCKTAVLLFGFIYQATSVHFLLSFVLIKLLCRVWNLNCSSMCHSLYMQTNIKAARYYMYVFLHDNNQKQKSVWNNAVHFCRIKVSYLKSLQT